MSIQQDAIHTISLKHGIVAYVVRDDDPDSPAEWDNVAVIAYRGGEYRRNQNPFGSNTGESPESFAERVERAKEGKIIAIAVDVRDHGSNGTRLYAHTDLEDCDALFYCTPQKAVEEWGGESDKLATILAEALTQECRAKAEAFMKGEVETWQQYFEGDVYEVVVQDADGEPLDSCGGYYGYDYAESEAKQMGEAQVKAFEKRRRDEQRAARKERAERLFWSFRGVVTA